MWHYCLQKSMKLTKKEQIENKAKELFWKHGFKKVTIDEICKKANVSRKTFYTFYENKTALVLFILNETIENMKTENMKVFASDIPFGEKMKVYEGRGLYDTKNSKITAFKITQTILSDYRLKKYDELWSIDAMKDRWEWFCDQAGEILEIDAGALKQNPPS